MSTETITLIVVVLAILYAVLSAFIPTLRIKLPTSLDTWKAFLRGQFIVLLAFLTLGGLFGGLSAFSSRYVNKPNKMDQVKEYPIDATTRKLYEENVEPYARIVIIARVEEPKDGSANLMIFQSRPGEASPAPTSLPLPSSTWARVDLPNNYSTLGLMVEPPEKDKTAATKVSVFTYLSTK